MSGDETPPESGTAGAAVEDRSEPDVEERENPEGPGTADSADATDGGGWTPAWLADLRANDGRRRAALVAAAMVGVALAWAHWLGLFVAGALVGLASETWPRALAAGLGVGVLVLLVQVGASPAMDPGELLALTPAAYVTVAAGLAAPLWGSLVRGVV